MGVQWQKEDPFCFCIWVVDYVNDGIFAHSMRTVNSGSYNIWTIQLFLFEDMFNAPSRVTARMTPHVDLLFTVWPATPS